MVETLDETVDGTQATDEIPPSTNQQSPDTNNTTEALPSPYGPVPLDVKTEVDAAEGNNRLRINFYNAPIREALELLSEQADLNILVSPNVQGTVNATLNNVDVPTALGAVLKLSGLAARQEGPFLYVGTSQDIRQMEIAGERLLTRVYHPNYISAAEIEALVTPLLTEGVGSVNTSTAAQTGIQSDESAAGGDEFAGHEVVLVKDLESVLWQIDQLIAELDKMPRQVVIEALILSVKLDDSISLGVDFELLRNKGNIRLMSSNALTDLAEYQRDA